MSDEQNVFYDEWRDCLAEHYIYVVRTQDHLTEPTLRTILLDTGFTPDEIDKLYDIALNEDD